MGRGRGARRQAHTVVGTGRAVRACRSLGGTRAACRRRRGVPSGAALSVAGAAASSRGTVVGSERNRHAHACCTPWPFAPICAAGTSGRQESCDGGRGGSLGKRGVCCARSQGGRRRHGARGRAQLSGADVHADVAQDLSHICPSSHIKQPDGASLLQPCHPRRQAAGAPCSAKKTRRVRVCRRNSARRP